MGKMYYITNGHKYIQKEGYKYKETSCAALSDVFPYKQAMAILNNSLSKSMKNYYLEEKETGEVFDINKHKSEAKTIVENKHISFDMSIVNEIKNEASNIMGLYAYTQKELIEKNEILNKALSFYDLGLSDLIHIIEKYNPPAHIRTIIYGKQQKLRQIHTDIKQAMQYIDIMINAHTNNWDIKKIQEKLKEVTYVPYKGRTCFYDEIMQMIG